MMLYENNLLDEFTDFLPALREKEVYYICILSRKKYGKTEEERQQLRWEEQLGRDIVRDKSQFKDKILKLIRSLEWKDDNTVLKGYGNEKKEIPSYTITIYYDPNPKDMVKVMFNFQKKLNDMIYEYVNTLENGNDLSQLIYMAKGLDKLLLTEIHKEGSKKRFQLIDIDDTYQYVLDDVLTVLEKHNLNRYIHYIAETRSGYHILMKLPEEKAERKEYGKFMHNDFLKYTGSMRTQYNIEIEFKTKGFLTPVVGTWQSGKLVKMIKI